MGFMIPTAEYFAAYHVETNCGTEIVPRGKPGCSRSTARDRESNPSSANKVGMRAFPQAGISTARHGTGLAFLHGLPQAEGT
jgi:hypothetical protein